MEDVYSATQKDWVRNIQFDIMEETVMQIVAKVVREVKRRRPGVQRIRLGELWASPSCNTFCKLGPINKEHQFRDAEDPLQRSIEGTEKGDLAKEVDKLVNKTLLLIVTLACMNARQGWEEKMQVVEGVELVLRGMKWFMENPVGMLAMQGYMIEFVETMPLPVVRLQVDYCAWGQFYMKPTHMWTSMVYWKPKGAQEEVHASAGNAVHSGAGGRRR